MLNSNSSFRDDYLVIKYNDELTYKNRVLSCLNDIDDNEIVLFCHEDMFLYKKPNFEIIDKYINLIKNENYEFN